jgi:hypothetical protein
MSLLIKTMLATASLAAFTASAPQARPIRVAAVGGTAPANAQRGSLLDLSV